MHNCLHTWEMTNIQFGFVVFERCSHCGTVRTSFSTEVAPVLGDRSREGDCNWIRVENAQSIRFDLKCTRCGRIETLPELMGLLHCTGCLPDCEVEILQRKYESENTHILVGFGFLPKKEGTSPQTDKLDILTDYYNHRRDTSRSRIKIVSFDLIEDFSLCRGDFIHDVGMLSLEPPDARKTLL